jgi:hypothetical protein
MVQVKGLIELTVRDLWRDVSGRGPGGAVALLRLSPGSLAQSAYHQHHLAGLPGSATEDQAHELLAEPRQRGPHHLRCD